MVLNSRTRLFSAKQIKKNTCSCTHNKNLKEKYTHTHTDTHKKTHSKHTSVQDNKTKFSRSCNI